MDKLKMSTPNLADEKFAALASMFPNAVTETIDENGVVVRAIDADILAQEINTQVVSGKEERYQFTWPDKKKSVLLANAPIAAALRPCREESVEFDNTENLYIEGDNLDVLKLLRETYLNRVKLIYIDPPYNTSHDFIYNDDFTENAADFLGRDSQYDEQGNRLVMNFESNGRFHTDWLNMIYPRIRLAKDLLTDDGIIFISINDKEVQNLKKICTEIFGERNEVATLIWDKNHSAQAGIYKVYHEYVLVYCRNIDFISRPTSLENDLFEAGAMKKESGRHPLSTFKFPAGTRFDAPDGTEFVGEYGDVEKVYIVEGRMIAKNKKLAADVTLKAGFTQANQMRQFFYGDRENLVDSQGQKIVEFYFNSTGKIKVVKQRSVETPQTTCKFGTQGAASNELSALFELEDCPFSAPKPVNMLTDFIQRFTQDDDIIMDFFSGSATTAHAVMQVNSNSENGKRKYILVQLQENLDESLKRAQKDSVRTLEVAIEYLNSHGLPHLITEIGKERIRRAGKKIKEDNKDKPGIENLDIGFRVLKLDSSNMKEVYYIPEEYAQMNFNLEGFMDNIKPDRTEEDLLFQVMLDLGIPLSAKIRQDGETFYVNDNYLIASFGRVDTDLITEIAKKKPYYAVFRDSSFINDSAMVNFEQVFSTYSPNTIRKVL
jgi:adenine-specific DNA-methyltransferase